MTSLFNGSYLAIKADPKTLLPIFCQHFGLKLLEENQTKFEKILLHKLWRRKYLFAGNIPGLYFYSDTFTIFYEENPSTLYHSADAIKNLSAALETPVYNYYYDQSSKSCGIKIHQKGQIERRLESEIDYTIETNTGNTFEFELDLFKENPLFNQSSLSAFLQLLQIPVTANLQSPDLKLYLCHFTR